MNLNYVKEQMNILEHASTVTNQNYVGVLKEIHSKYFPYSPIILQQAFSFGVMIGKRQERDLRKWNALACFHNMKSYARMHDGQLPKSYDKLMIWLNRKNKVGGCHE